MTKRMTRKTAVKKYLHLWYTNDKALGVPFTNVYYCVGFDCSEHCPSRYFRDDDGTSYCDNDITQEELEHWLEEHKGMRTDLNVRPTCYERQEDSNA